MDELSEARIKRDWLAAYTLARHEFSVARQLESKAIAIMLPTYTCDARSAPVCPRLEAVLAE
jgi:hypothetical protein